MAGKSSAHNLYTSDLAKVFDRWHAAKGGTKAAAATLAKMHPNQITKLCELYGPGSTSDRSSVAEALIAARKKIVEAAGVEDPWNKPPPDITRLKVDKSLLPKPIDFVNFHGPGNGLSSKAHVNEQNTKDDEALIAFAAKGNLNALKDYHYDAVDKDTGAGLGKKPIAVHPSKHVKNHWSDLVDLLSAVANPPVDGLSMPPIDAGTVAEISEGVGYFKPGEMTSTISAENVLGYWMKLGNIGNSVSDLKPSVEKYFKTATMYQKAKNWYQGTSAAVKAYISSVTASGGVNHVWSDPTHSDAAGTPKQKMAAALHKEAWELEEGFVLNRWMNMSKEMMEKLLSEGPGLVFQNTDSMCTSVFKNWGEQGKFGTGAFLKIYSAEGAKATMTLGSGAFSGKSTDAEGNAISTGSGEMEVTTIPGARFVVLGVKKGNASSPNGITMELLMLPPHEGYVAELGKQAALGKAFILLMSRPLLRRGVAHA